MRPNRVTSSSERCFRDAGRFNGTWEAVPCGIGDCFVPIMESAAIDAAECGEEPSAADPKTGVAEQIHRNNTETNTLTRTRRRGNCRVSNADGTSVL